MPSLTLIDSKSDDEKIKKEIEEIQLPLFDIIIHEDESWFEEMITEQNDVIEKIKRDHNIH